MISDDTLQMMKKVVKHPIDSIWMLFQLLSRDEVFESSVLCNLAAGLPDRLYNKYKGEIDYLSDFLFLDANPCKMFPYKDVRSMPVVEAGWDKKAKLPYVMHKGKRFYSCNRFSVERACAEYRYFLGIEGILGTGIKEKSPHSYVDKDFYVEPGDVVLDVGCSDALFALDNVDNASQIFLFEVDKRWKRPLENTFKPYSEKVSIINKLVSSRNSKNEIRLADALADVDKNKTFFIKMDIEGFEREVISASEDFLKSHKVKLSCCVYHRQDDAVVIKDMLEKMGYKTRFSDGYMLLWKNGIHFPYFRRGVIYAQNY
jgi:hypothetical protein